MIEINNLTETKINEALLKKTADLVFKEEGLKNPPYFSLAFVGPGRMRKINKAYLKKNKATDVLSFVEQKASLGKYKIGRLEKIQGLGEIIICPREVKKNAKREKASFKDELLKVFIHGVLHLLSYDHEQGGKRAIEMAQKEEYYFKIAL